MASWRALCSVLAPLIFASICIGPVLAQASDRQSLRLQAQAVTPTLQKIMGAECLKPGDNMRVQGRHLDAQAGLSLSLIDANGALQPLKIQSLSERFISTRLPRNLPSEDYRLSLSQRQTPIGNSVALNLCEAKTSTLRVTPDSALPAPKLETRSEPSVETELEPELESENRSSLRSSLSEEGDFGPRDAVRQYGSLAGRSLPTPRAIKFPTQSHESSDDDLPYEARQALFISQSLDEATRLQATLKALKARVKRRSTLDSLGWVLTLAEVPKGQSIETVLETLQVNAPNQWMDLNHRYSPLAADKTPPQTKVSFHPKKWAFQSLGWSERHRQCRDQIQIGLIDDGVHEDFFPNRSLTQKAFIERGEKLYEKGHGTAIASLFWGSEALALPALLPSASIVSAQVFSDRRGRQVATTERLLKALDWLASQRIRVINMSLGGPPNRILSLALDRLAEAGVQVVAAADIDAAGQSLHPAALDSVVAVKAHDVRMKPRKPKVEGDYIDVSAPGVDLWLMTAKGTGRYQTGSSFAAPFMVAAIALGLEPTKSQGETPNLDVSTLCVR